MCKRIIFAVVAMLLCQVGFADICPSIKDIKSNVLKEWKAYDSDDGTPLSSAREAQFKQSIEQFALVEWATQDNHHNEIRCYYRDQHGSHLEAYLAKRNFSPANKKDYWYQVSGYMECAAGVDKCEFQEIPLQNQLANR